MMSQFWGEGEVERLWQIVTLGVLNNCDVIISNILLSTYFTFVIMLFENECIFTVGNYNYLMHQDFYRYLLT